MKTIIMRFDNLTWKKIRKAKKIKGLTWEGWLLYLINNQKIDDAVEQHHREEAMVGIL